MGLLLQPLPRGEQWVCKRKEKSAKESCFVGGDLQGEPAKQVSFRSVLPDVRGGRSPKPCMLGQEFQRPFDVVILCV